MQTELFRSGPSTPLIGREEQLALLTRKLGDAIAGRPSVVVLEGDAGIGKSHLLREFMRRAVDRGAVGLVGRCSRELAAPYSAFWSLFDALHDDVGVSEPDFGLDRDWLQQLSGLVAPSVAASEHAEALRGRLFLGFSQRTLELCRRTQVVLNVEDFHWADRGSVDLLSHLACVASDASRSRPCPLLIVVSLRPLARDVHASKMLERLSLEIDFERATLLGLSEFELVELLRVHGVTQPANQLVATLMQSSSGNPLFIVEALRCLSERGALERRGREIVTNATPGELDIPPTITAAIEARLSELSAESRAVLAEAAVMSSSETAVFTGLEQRFGVVSVQAALQSGLAHRVLVRQKDGSLTFASAAVKGTLLGATTPEQLKRIHAEIAVSMAANPLPESEHFRMATHLVAAAELADPSLVLQFCPAAADRALAALSATEAVRHYEAALKAVERGGRLDRSALADLLQRASAAHIRNGDPGLASSLAERALLMYRELGDDVRSAELMMEQVRTLYTRGLVGYGGRIDLNALEAALRGLGDRATQLRARMCVVLCSAFWTQRRTEPALRYSRQALELAKLADDPSTCADASTMLGMSQFQALQLAAAVDSLHEAVAWGRSADLWAQGRAAQRLPLPLIALGELARAERVADDAARLVRTTHDWAGLSHSAAVRSTALSALGLFDEAISQAELSLRMVQRSRYSVSLGLAVPALASAHAQRSRWLEARAALSRFDVEPSECNARSTGVGFLVFVYMQLMASESGDRTRNAELFTIAERGSQYWRTDAYAVTLLCALTDLGLSEEQPERCAWLVPWLTAACDAGMRITVGWPLCPARCLGALQSALGQVELAQARLSMALDQTRQSEAWPEYARCQLELARLLLRRRAGTDREHAAMMLGSALAYFRKLAMQQRMIEVYRLAKEHDLQLEEGSAKIVRNQLPSAASIGQRRELRHIEPGQRCVFFSDMEGFTALIDRLGDVQARLVIRVHDRIVRAAVQAFGGSEIQHTGDGMMVAFESAPAAVSCAVRLHRDFEQHSRRNPNRAMRVRIGIDAGVPLQQEDRLFGAVVNAAARLCARASAGETLISENVRILLHDPALVVRSLGQEILKGFSKPFEVFSVQQTFVSEH